MPVGALCISFYICLRALDHVLQPGTAATVTAVRWRQYGGAAAAAHLTLIFRPRRWLQPTSHPLRVQVIAELRQNFPLQPHAQLWPQTPGAQVLAVHCQQPRLVLDSTPHYTTLHYTS